MPSKKLCVYLPPEGLILCLPHNTLVSLKLLMTLQMEMHAFYPLTLIWSHFYALRRARPEKSQTSLDWGAEPQVPTVVEHIFVVGLPMFSWRNAAAGLRSSNSLGKGMFIAFLKCWNSQAVCIKFCVKHWQWKSLFHSHYACGRQA